MKDGDRKPPVPHVPLDAARRIHEICKRFEAAWHGSPRPPLETFLAESSGAERLQLLTELLALEVDLRREAGEEPTEAEYRRAIPGEPEAGAIAEAFRRCADLEDERRPGGPGPRDLPSTFQPSADAGHRPPDGGRHPRAEPLDGAAGMPGIDGYEVLEVLGRGGMGVVYKARDVRLKRVVAVKMVLGSEFAGGELLARFRTEAETVARLQHPNIVQIFDVGAQDGHPYLAFEYVEGPTLSEFSGREPQPARVAAEVLEALAHAMHYAHQHGVVHRDLKPANVLLATGGHSASSRAHDSHGSRRAPSAGTLAQAGRRVTSAGLVPKITDFGLAKDLAANREHTSTGAILGTPNYMSPEQADGRRDIGPATDIYSLGVILYVLLTGRPPFQGPTQIETLKMVVRNDPVPPTQLVPGLAKDLETICLKCLHKEPARRYITAGDLADDVRRFLNDEAILARASSRFEKAWRWSRRNLAVAVSLASVLLVLLAGVVVSTFFAHAAREEAALARKAEQEATDREQAEIAARKEANELRERAEEAVSETLFDKGLTHCENRDVTLGLLTMAAALERAPPGAGEISEAIRLNLAFWQRQLCVLKTHGGYQSSMTAAAFAPDGQSFLTGDWGNHQNIPGPPYLVVHHVNDGESERMTEHAEAIWRVAYSPDGRRFASASFDGTARLWDAATRRLVGQPLQHAGRVYSLAFSPDSQRLLTGSHHPDAHDSRLRVWHADSGMAAGEPVTVPGAVRAVAWSGDGRLWVSGAAEIHPVSRATRGGKIHFWDAATQQSRGEPLRTSDPVTAVAFRPHSDTLAYGTEDGLVRFWKPAGGERVGKILQHRFPLSALQFSRDGRYLLTASGEKRPEFEQGGEARLWNVNTGQLAVPPLVHPGKVNDVALSPDQRSIVAACDNGQMYVWKVGVSMIPAFVLRQPGVQHTLLTPDGGALITLARDDASRNIVVQHWEPRTGRPLDVPLRVPFTVLNTDPERPIQGLRNVVLRPDGRWAASAEWLELAPRQVRQGAWFFWDTVTHELLEVPGEVRGAERLVFSRDSRWLAVCRRTAEGDSACRVWDVEQWEPHGKIIRIKAHVFSLLFAADGHSLLTGTDDGIVRRWKIADGSLLNATPKLADLARSLQLQLSPDGRQLLSSRHTEDGGAQAQLWSVQDLTPVGPSSYGRADWLFTCRFVPGGRYYVGHGHGPVQVWDTTTGEQLRTLNEYGGVEHRYAAFPSGEYVALGVTQHQVRLWHLETGRFIGPELSFPARVEQLAFSPDGTALYVTCNDGSVRCFSLPAAQQGSPPRVKWETQMVTRRRLDVDGSLLDLGASQKDSVTRGMSTLLPTSEQEPQVWRFTTEKPAENWHRFDGAIRDWQQGPGAFGTSRRPRGLEVIRTGFAGPEIWLRRDFELQEKPAGELFVRLLNQTDARIYLNGVLAAAVSEPLGYYATVPVSAAAAESLRVGKNTLTIHCLQNSAEGYIDAGLVQWRPLPPTGE